MKVRFVRKHFRLTPINYEVPETQHLQSTMLYLRRTDSLNYSRPISRVVLHQARSLWSTSDTMPIGYQTYGVTTSTLVVVTRHLPEHEYLVRH